MLSKERVNRWVGRWKERLLLDNWGVTLSYEDDDIHQQRSDAGNPPVAAEIVVDARYTEARVKLFPILGKRPAAYQELTLVHELIHIATDPVKLSLEKAVKKGVISEKEKDNVLESITEYISKVVYKAYGRNRKDFGDYHL